MVIKYRLLTLAHQGMVTGQVAINPNKVGPTSCNNVETFGLTAYFSALIDII